ncbi:MAG: hypothetical protein DMF29_03900 [Verrucomicrobia bacterium]|nr:MAG: hypothetical protein DMF29_03900 [Verrucomicrobiota bacterium]
MLFRLVIPSGARNLAVEAWITQVAERDQRACERSFTSFRMTTRESGDIAVCFGMIQAMDQLA